MACQTCINQCCVKPCVEELVCHYECCGCCHIPVLLIPDQDLPAGTILAQRASDLRFGPFDPLATDGLQFPKGFLKYHVLTDENGNVVHRYFGYLGLGLDCGQPYTNMYICGIFRTQDIVGDLASAVATPNFGRIVEGTVDAGLVKI